MAPASPSFLSLATPAQQLHELSQKPENKFFMAAACKISEYLEDKSRLEVAVDSVFSSFDALFFYTITHRVDDGEQRLFRTEIRVLLQRIFQAQHPVGARRYHPIDISVRDSLNSLGMRMKRKLLATYPVGERELPVVAAALPEAHPFGVRSDSQQWDGVGPH